MPTEPERSDNPSDATAKRDAPVMVYLTPTERSAFKTWSRQKNQSMSDVLYEMITELMDAPHRPAPRRPRFEAPIPVTAPSVPAGGQLRDKASEFANIAACLASLLWSELEQGARLPDLAEETGLPTEQLQHILRASAIPSPETDPGGPAI